MKTNNSIFQVLIALFCVTLFVFGIAVLCQIAVSSHVHNVWCNH